TRTKAIRLIRVSCSAPWFQHPQRPRTTGHTGSDSGGPSPELRRRNSAISARGGHPAGAQPQPFGFVQDDLAARVLGDGHRLLPAQVAHVQRAGPGLVVVHEDRLLPVLVLEVAVVFAPLAAVDDGRFTAA